MQPLVINFKNQKNSTALSFLSAKINEMGTFSKKNQIFKGQYRTGAGAGDKIRGQVEPETK